MRKLCWRDHRSPQSRELLTACSLVETNLYLICVLYLDKETLINNRDTLSLGLVVLERANCVSNWPSACAMREYLTSVLHLALTALQILGYFLDRRIKYCYCHQGVLYTCEQVRALRRGPYGSARGHITNTKIVAPSTR